MAVLDTVDQGRFNVRLAWILSCREGKAVAYHTGLAMGIKILIGNR